MCSNSLSPSSFSWPLPSLWHRILLSCCLSTSNFKNTFSIECFVRTILSFHLAINPLFCPRQTFPGRKLFTQCRPQKRLPVGWWSLLSVFFSGEPAEYLTDRCLNNSWLEWNAPLKKEEMSVYLKGNDVCVCVCVDQQVQRSQQSCSLTFHRPGLQEQKAVCWIRTHPEDYAFTAVMISSTQTPVH